MAVSFPTGKDGCATQINNKIVKTVPSAVIDISDFVSVPLFYSELTNFKM